MLQIIVQHNPQLKLYNNLMFSKHFTSATLKVTEQIFPQIQVISLSKVVNYFSMNLYSDNRWTYNNSIEDQEQYQAEALLHAVFRNHLMDLNGFQRLQQIYRVLKKLDISRDVDIYEGQGLKEQQKKLYILGNSQDFISKKLMASSIMKQKSISKILCFEKSKPINIPPSFETFCIQNNIRALGLSNFSSKSLVHQIKKHSKMPILVHHKPLSSNQLFIPQKQIAKQQKFDETHYSNMAEEILMLCNWQQERCSSKQEYLSLDQLLKNYMPRTYNSKTDNPYFSVKRFQRIDQVYKYQQIVKAEEGIPNDDEDEEED